MTDNAEIVAQALDRLVARYVFPARAGEIDRTLRPRLARGVYDGLSGPELCEKVTADLQEICPDRHLRLLWSEDPQPTAPQDEDEGRAAFLALLREQNQGIHRFQHLEGNVGHLDVRVIADPETGAAAMGAAMLLVAGTAALVLDLRACRGGSPAGAALWCSHFFADDTHLNDIYDRATDSTRQYWSASHLPGPRYQDRPVYVLTSTDTFSGGEDVAYTLQAHGRAVVVGETSRGGAHPAVRCPLTEHVTVTVPTARTVNAVTGTNWEGTGVVPDLPCPADAALTTAHEAAQRETAS